MGVTLELRTLRYFVAIAEAGTVSGRLGEWLEIGGSAGAGFRADSGALSQREVQRSSERRIWVKVDEARN